MSDFKAYIKLEMEFQNKTEKLELDINYIPGFVDGIDDRIIEFFQKCYNSGIARYQEKTITNERE
jgi:hypothetical protein